VFSIPDGKPLNNFSFSETQMKICETLLPFLVGLLKEVEELSLSNSSI